ncbi:MAG: hypothetical protein FWE25_09440 [Lachnospiraceae bacterium]|nr:hypothetical protein [Lachnospiraceae bacterium]
MRIALKFKAPFRVALELEYMDIDIPKGSTIRDMVGILLEKPDIRESLIKHRLLIEDNLPAIYVMNKHINGGMIVREDRILEESDVLTILGVYIGG